MKTYTITCEDGTWTVDDGITGQDGYPSRLAAAYAARMAGWGGTYPRPDEAQDVVDAGWTEEATPNGREGTMKSECVAEAKRFLDGAPREGKSAPGLAGFSGGIGFLCAPCASRISARGMGLLRSCGATMPVWTDHSHDACSLCGKGETP